MPSIYQPYPPPLSPISGFPSCIYPGHSKCSPKYPRFALLSHRYCLPIYLLSLGKMRAIQFEIHHNSPLTSQPTVGSSVRLHINHSATVYVEPFQLPSTNSLAIVLFLADAPLPKRCRSSATILAFPLGWKPNAKTLVLGGPHWPRPLVLTPNWLPSLVHCSQGSPHVPLKSRMYIMNDRRPMETSAPD